MGATLQRDWPDYHYRIYKLEPAMQPGEIRELRFITTLAERGFPNANPLTRIVANGSFLDSTEIAPGIGISREGLLKDRAKRRKYGLPVDLRPPTLEDESGRARSGFRADSDWVTADRAGLHGQRHHGPRPPHGALQARDADQPLLLDPVGALRGAPRRVERRRP